MSKQGWLAVSRFTRSSEPPAVESRGGEQRQLGSTSWSTQRPAFLLVTTTTPKTAACAIQQNVIHPSITDCPHICMY